MNKRFKIIITDDEVPVMKRQGTFDEIDKMYEELKIKYKGRR